MVSGGVPGSIHRVTIAQPPNSQNLQFHELVMSRLEIGLLQPDAHREYFLGRKSLLLCPTLGHRRHMPFMEDMRARDLSLHWQHILNNRYGDCLESEPAGQSCENCAAQHSDEPMLLSTSWHLMFSGSLSGAMGIY